MVQRFSKIQNPQSEIQRGVLKWPGKKKENHRRKRGGREEETCQNAKEGIALRPDPRCTTVACRQEGAVNPVKILIVDNHPAIRHGLLGVIGDEKDIVVCGEAGDRQETLEATHHDTLDFVILDVSLKDPSRTGFDFIPDIHSHLGPIPILVCPEKPLLFFHRGHPCAKNNTV